MQQLLSLNGQSELFTKLADEVSLSSGQSAAKEGSTEFSRALLAGLDAVQKEIAATTTKAKGEQSEQRMQRIALDDEVVGEPVESPMLEMLEEMRALLQPGKTEADAESDAELESITVADGSTDIELMPGTNTENESDSDAAISKLSDIIAKLGTNKLTDEQRQNLAEELSNGLSESEKEALMALDTDALTAASDEQYALLQKLQSVSELAELAIQSTQQKQADTAIAPLDNEAQQWLRDQLQQLQQTAQSQNNQVSDEGESGNILQLLQQKVSAAKELDQQQKQQLQQWLTAAETKLAVAAEGQQQASQELKSLQWVQDLQKLLADGQRETTSRARVAEAAALSEQRQVTDRQANAERFAEALSRQEKSSDGQRRPILSATEIETTEQKVANAATDADGKTKPRDELSGLAELGSKVKPSATQQDGASVAQLLEGATKAAPVTASDTATSFSENLINQQTASVSTQSGTVKASELSSTLQSTMQAVQKPLDPQQSEASQKLQERINIMLSKNIQRADIRLDPPELGQLNVRINMNAEQATVQFQVQSAQARDAVEQALPRLREMLEQQGVALADTDVQEQQQQMAGDAEQQQGGGSRSEASVEQPGEHEILLNEGRPLAAGGVDFYV
ncbi:flagellar hook-length control protein FliK [Idiomarina aquatica]|uniref:Flagellar hook-length control protein FliK n=1 Tax=Idiomarina aquatica TaxID=1327752 RepID=A0A4R6NYN8_9GAMM|nr:flagellar hook-length control protein FliK [Idiomarina aquatica]TDP28668.1 flagellar hook-length control protein FliK [Idiomarina aquatica]